MTAKILSLNVGGPSLLEWNGQNALSSMCKMPVPGPLIVDALKIAGDSFANPQAHGTPESVLYAMGKASMDELMSALGRGPYEPGSLGENVTLDALDEADISVGDIFHFGEVVAQVTSPRFPCHKVNLRMQHSEAQRLMIELNRSGVYFRILSPGQIHLDSKVHRRERAATPFMLQEFYQARMKGIALTPEQYQRAVKNGAAPKRYYPRWATEQQT